jgi:hypothetical protein
MEAKVAIVPYSERYREAHQTFAMKMWPRTRRRHEEKYLRWKFRGPINGELEGLLLAVMNDTVAGQLGLIPVKIRVGSQNLNAQWACNLVVDPVARRKGIGSKLYKAATAGNKVSLGSNPTVASDAVATQVGFREIQGPRVMVLPVKLNHVLSWKVPDKMKFLIPFLSQIGRPIMAWRSRELRKSGRQNIIKRCSWHELVPLIEQRQKLLSCPHVIHDLAFLQWRCSGLPGFAPKLYAFATDAEGYAIIEEGGPYLYVHDWFASNRIDFIALFQEIFKIACEAGSQTIQTLAQDGKETEMLLSAGFLAMRHRVKIICHPPETFIPTWDRFSYCLYDSDGNL